jgi:hypothetical protein
MNTLNSLMNNFNGISLLVIVALSYCAVLKNTQRHKNEIKTVFNRRFL